MSTSSSRQPARSTAFLHLSVTSSSEATIAVLDGTIDGESYVWTGVAKRFPGDKYVPSIGRKLAIGRALASAGRQLIKQGNGLVKCTDHNREAAKKSREARQNGALEVHRVQRRSQKRVR